MSPVEVHVHVETLADLHGQWCDTCLLPSLTVKTVLIHLDWHVQGPYIIEGCRQCGHRQTSLPS